MNCRLVFFAARKTSFCERALQKSFSELDLELVKTCFATDSEQLGVELTDAFKKLNVVFVVGGLGFDDEKGIKSIISRALCETPVNDCKKLKTVTTVMSSEPQTSCLFFCPTNPLRLKRLCTVRLRSILRQTR